jgi:hypothetical protein
MAMRCWTRCWDIKRTNWAVLGCCIGLSHCFEDSIHTQIVMDHTSDSRHHFDPNNYVEVLDARRRFRELTEAGYTAAKKTGNGTSEVIRQFDPTAKEMLFIPRLVGG